MKKFFIPFQGFGKDKHVRLVSIGLVPFIVWTLLPNHTFPPLYKILMSYDDLLSKFDLARNFSISLQFCIKSMLYSALIAFFFMLITRIPIFQYFAIFCRKFRFLPSAGLSFLFMKLTNDVNSQMSWIMIFGITTFMVDSAVGIALSISKDDVDYARSLRLNDWQTFRELVIYSKSPDFLRAINQNFAIAWMLLATVENIFKSSGGIGVVLAESSKYFRLEEVYAIQILILLTGIAIDYALGMIYYWLFPYKTLKRV